MPDSGDGAATLPTAAVVEPNDIGDVAHPLDQEVPAIGAVGVLAGMLGNIGDVGVVQDLGKELFRVDLSQMTSKWIGETEKNIAKVFEEARRHEAVLLFDEADSLFGSRGDVKQAQDRFANQECLAGGGVAA